jgi:nitric oxide reductase subunit B
MTDATRQGRDSGAGSGAHTLFNAMIALLVIYALVALLGAAQFVDDRTLWGVMPYHQVGAWAAVLLRLALLTGLIGGGLAMIQTAGERTRALLPWLVRGWLALLVLAFFAGLLGLLEGRSGLELPPLLDVAQAVLLVGFIGVVADGTKARDAFSLVWLLGVGIVAAGGLLGLLLTGDPLRDQIYGTLAAGLMLNVGAVLAMVALAFGLLYRTGALYKEGAESSTYFCGGLLALAGGVVTVAPLNVANGGSALLQGLTVIVALFSAGIFALRILRAANGARVLRWLALAVLLLFGGLGLLGALTAIEAVGRWTLGTRLSDLQTLLTALAVVSVGLGAAEAVREEHRVVWRGLAGAPFWLVAVGVIVVGVALAGAGLVQVYLERVVGVGYLETQEYLAPLYAAWIAGLVAAGLGLLAFGLAAGRKDNPTP